MNKYLLLRDNKESGPYTVEELSAKGLKAYDLVWLEGKSAAWRYPSEIGELQSFAPVVEEQPYDRFYKKKPELQGEVVVKEIPVTSTLSTKNIYVTLPAGAKRAGLVQTEKASSVTVVKPIAEVKPQSTMNETVEVVDLTQKFEQVREEKMRQAQLMAANPAVKHTGQKVDATVIDTYQPAEQIAVAPARNRNRTGILMRGIVAACLLLGGVIIGLLISNGRQQANQEAIEKLAQQIKENRSIEVVTPPPPAPAITQQEPGLEQEVTNDNISKETAGHAATGPAPHNVAGQGKEKPADNRPGQVVQASEQPVKIVQAVVTNKPEEKTINRAEVEKARRNIHQMVSLDASQYKTGVLGGISDLHLTISNNSDFSLDQIEVEVRFLGPEKRVVKTQTMLFNDVAAGETKTLEAPKTSRGISVDYAIVHINSRALGLASAGY